jgi:group II intron reverse transcriptase/maturase
MVNAETYLAIVRDRGSRGLPLEDVYRQLFNPALYLRAYGKIYRNDGAMTPGVTAETVDGMSLDKIQTIIAALRSERYVWSPARRTYIEKKHSTKQRPLGLPTWSDKLLQEVIRMILEAYYEPQFSDHSHGFRRQRGCHTALREIYRTWKGTVWFLEGDIARCFDSLDHTVLMTILREKIHDNRFLRLIENLLQAGYLEEWQYHATLSGSPQGGIVSPLLANIYLDRLDQFVEQTLTPSHNRGAKREIDPVYQRLMTRAASLARQGRPEEARKLRQQGQQMPAMVLHDPHYRRLRYVRYADDFLLGFVGPRHEAETIKRQLGAFLRDHLKLELSEEKTLITHGRTRAARFLGYEVVIHHNNRKHTGRRRSINGVVGFKVPADVMREKCRRYRKGGQPIQRCELVNESAYTLVARYQQEYRGIVNYYRLAYNLHQFAYLKWNMECSLTKTLAQKLKVSVPKVYKRFATTLATDQGPRKGFQVRVERGGEKPPLVAQWGGISLEWDVQADLDDQPQAIWGARSELVDRLLADQCELCGSAEHVQVHHIRHLKDVQQPGRRAKPEWMKVMAKRCRKTLVVCLECHQAIHAGRLQRHSAK